MSRLLRLAGLGVRLGAAGGTLVLLNQQGVWGDSAQVRHSVWPTVVQDPDRFFPRLDPVVHI
jgi:hypothetical protein